MFFSCLRVTVFSIQPKRFDKTAFVASLGAAAVIANDVHVSSFEVGGCFEIPRELFRYHHTEEGQSAIYWPIYKRRLAGG